MKTVLVTGACINTGVAIVENSPPRATPFSSRAEAPKRWLQQKPLTAQSSPA